MRTVRLNRSNRAVASGLVLALALLCAALWAAPAAAQVRLVPFGGQSFAQPYHVAAPPGDASRVFVVEAAGRIRLVRNGVTRSGYFLNIASDVFDAAEGCGGECGMFSMAFAPDYASSGRFYVFYTRDISPGNHYLRIEEFRRSAGNPDVANPASRRIVLEIPHTTAGNHNGGQLQFGPDKLLYIWTGDGGDTPNLAQNLGSRLGKLLRIDPRGRAPFHFSIPAGNPFVDGPGPNADDIYAYGLRNPYRGSFDRATGDLTIGDVGAGSWEEIDFAYEGTARGANFGWPCYEGNQVHSTAGACTPPLANYRRPALQYANPPAGAAAVNGGFVVRDPALPSLRGRYVYADTYGAVPGVRSVRLFPGGSSGDASLGFAVTAPVSFGQDACGHIYVASQTGPVYRLQPSSGPFPCKLAPSLSLKLKKAKRAAKKGAIVIPIACDEDCDARARGFIKVKGRRKKVRARPDSARVQVGTPVRLRLDLTKKQGRKVRRALKRGRKAWARIVVSATGGGGGTDVERRKVRQKRPKAKKRKRR